MSLFSVPLSWGEPRLEYELIVVADEMNMELVTLRDRPLSTIAQSMHEHVLAQLAEKRRIIEERLGAFAAQPAG